MIDYLRRWQAFGGPAWRYLAHAALLTAGLAVTGLLFNLVVLALGHPRSLLGLLTSVGVAGAALLAVPLWWLTARVGLRRALIISAALQSAGALVVAFWPEQGALLLAAAITGGAAVLFQISAVPYMMQQSDEQTRDHLFSANAAVNIGVAGLGSLAAGYLPGLCAELLGVGPESAAAYRASFAVAGVGLALAIVPLLARERLAEAADPRGDAAAGKGQAGLIAALLARPWPLAQLLIPPALISCGAALLIPYLNLFFRERFALPDTTLGLIFAALGITTGAASLAGPLLSARVGKAQTIVVTQAISIPLLLAAGFVPLLAVAAAAAVARAALFNMGSPLYEALAMERSTPPVRPAVIGLVNAAYAGGYIVAPPLSVAVQERWGFAPLFVATAACYTLAVLATHQFFVRDRDQAVAG